MDAAHVARRDPLLGLSFYVDPDNPAVAQASEWRSAGRTADAAAIERIAKQPTADWFTGSEDVREAVRALTVRASKAHAGSLLVAYDIPGRDCGSFSAGGASSAAAYRRWIGLFAQGIGPRSATVILEPDAIAQALSGCLSPIAASERYELLGYAVQTLKADRHVNVYIDAGNPGWIQSAARLVAPLRRAGIAQADGFALNVSNFYATQATVDYGLKLSRALGGAHFVIDTGRNGNGPAGGKLRVSSTGATRRVARSGKRRAPSTGEPACRCLPVDQAARRKRRLRVVRASRRRGNGGRSTRSNSSRTQASRRPAGLGQARIRATIARRRARRCRRRRTLPAA